MMEETHVPVPTLRLFELMERVETLAQEVPGPGALVFDADGTLWEGDIGIDAFQVALERGLLREEVREALIAEVFKHRLEGELELDEAPEETDVNLLGQGLQRAFERGIYPERAATEMQVWAYAGWTEAEIREHARDCLIRGRLVSRIRRPLLPLLLRARELGLRTVVVSASPRIFVEEAARHLGFGPSDIAGGRAKRNAAGFLPALAEALPYGPGKVKAGRAVVGQATWLAVFGDSAFDAEMLSEAKLPVAVCPRPELLERLPEIPGAVLFEDDLG